MGTANATRIDNHVRWRRTQLGRRVPGTLGGGCPEPARCRGFWGAHSRAAGAPASYVGVWQTFERTSMSMNRETQKTPSAVDSGPHRHDAETKPDDSATATWLSAFIQDNGAVAGTVHVWAPHAPQVPQTQAQQSKTTPAREPEAEAIQPDGPRPQDGILELHAAINIPLPSRPQPVKSPTEKAWQAWLGPGQRRSPRVT